MCLKELIIGFWLLGDLGEECRKQGFVVGWMQSGSEGNSMIWYCNNFYIKEEGIKGLKL